MNQHPAVYCGTGQAAASDLLLVSLDRSIDYFLATIKPVGADMVTPMALTGGLLNRQRRALERIMRPAHATA